MSLLFPVHRPRVGLSFTERGLALVELRRGWGKPRLVRVHERALPDGILTPSATEPNVKDVDALAKELQALVAVSSERTVALCLPDRTCHLAVFPFETLPARARDREPILRWRFQHEEHATVGDSWILHRVFPMRSEMPAGPDGSNAEGQVVAFVLALAIKQSIVDQYEAVCARAGLLPVSIGCAALRLFDFFRLSMPNASELFFVHQALDSMTFVAVRQGMPVFCRTKACRRGQADFMREIGSTVQFYDDLYPRGASKETGSLPIYMVGEGCDRIVGSSDQSDRRGAISIGNEATSVLQPIFPDWKTLVSTQKATISSEEGLYALASVVGR